MMTDAGIEPDVQNVVFFFKLSTATFTARTFGYQFGSPQREPCIGTLLLKYISHMIDHLVPKQRRLTLVAIEDNNGYPPDPLPADTPVGPGGYHIADPLFAPSGDPAHLFDLFQGPLA